LGRTALLFAGAFGALAVTLGPGVVACGGASCGNGEVESGEQCDDGNTRDDDACSNSCEQRDTVDATIMWTLVANEVPGFSESCLSLGATKVKLELSGTMSFTQEVDCGLSELTLKAPPAGPYLVKGTLLDSMGMAITKGLAMANFTVAGADQDVMLDFPAADFDRLYNGTYLWRSKWGGATTCATATPQVVMTTIRLERGGQPLKTQSGVTLDGLTATPCLDFTGQMAGSFTGVPWGSATVIITGLDGTGTKRFEATLPTFVGAGVVNPTYEFDVPPL
jgi:cysteine-rich repeat protein